MLANEPKRSFGASLAEAFACWQDAAGPFWLYVCATPFLAGLGVEVATTIPPRLPAALARALERDREPGAAIFADLAPEVTLSATPILLQRGYRVVPVIQRWVAAPAVIPSETLLARLVAFRPPAPPVEARGVVFLLDRRRFGTAGPPLILPTPPIVRRHARLGRRFDNRYEYPICRFPPPELLREHGISRTVWLPGGIAPDLQPYATRLAATGLAAEPVVPTRFPA